MEITILAEHFIQATYASSCMNGRSADRLCSSIQCAGWTQVSSSQLCTPPILGQGFYLENVNVNVYLHFSESIFTTRSITGRSSASTSYLGVKMVTSGWSDGCSRICGPSSSDFRSRDHARSDVNKCCLVAPAVGIGAGTTPSVNREVPYWAPSFVTDSTCHNSSSSGFSGYFYGRVRSARRI